MTMKRVMSAVLIIGAIAVLLAHDRAEAREGFISGGDIIYTRPVKSVIFSHNVHVGEKGLTCDACHSGLFEPSALKAQEKKDFNMDSLYKGKYCGACHNGKTAFASNTQCARCHTGVKGQKAAEKKDAAASRMIQGPQEAIKIGSGDSAVMFSHQSHAASKNKCVDCHSGKFPMKRGKAAIKMDDLYQGKYCGSCHNGKAAFASTECAKCHAKVPAPKDLVYKVNGLGPVTFSHKFHTNSFACKDCHTKFFAMKKTQGKMTMEKINAGKFCGGCHNGKVASPATECNKCHK